MRVYLPCSRASLAALVAGHALGAPSGACAVTSALRAWFPEGDDEELEYAAQSRAADLSLGLVADDPSPRRIVVALDADAEQAPDVDELVGVRVMRPVFSDDVVAILIDTDEAVAAVQAAVQALERSAVDVPPEVIALDDYELAWFAPEELADVVAQP